MQGQRDALLGPMSPPDRATSLTYSEEARRCNHWQSSKANKRPNHSASEASRNKPPLGCSRRSLPFQMSMRRVRAWVRNAPRKAPCVEPPGFASTRWAGRTSASRETTEGSGRRDGPIHVRAEAGRGPCRLAHGTRQHLLSEHNCSQDNPSPVSSRPSSRLFEADQIPTACRGQANATQSSGRRASPLIHCTQQPRPLPRRDHPSCGCCKTCRARMLRSALSRLAPAAAACQGCGTPCRLSNVFGGQPFSGSHQQTRTVISVKVYPGKLQAAQRALTRVLLGDKVRTLA